MQRVSSVKYPEKEKFTCTERKADDQQAMSSVLANHVMNACHDAILVYSVPVM